MKANSAYMDDTKLKVQPGEELNNVLGKYMKQYSAPRTSEITPQRGDIVMLHMYNLNGTVDSLETFYHVFAVVQEIPVGGREVDDY
jgi:hypothetical protein